ncbi:MAG TPA: hypothetical protein VMX58_01130 [Patescibacteria group bacterium]|nr:hypothetical protein [Patescibacteria group bacterium]
MRKAIRKAVKDAFSKLGYRITRIPKNAEWRPGYTLHTYLKPDGSFDYEKYRWIQIEGNKKKIDIVWVLEENIAFLADYIKNAIGIPQFGICHGTRNGKEQEWFRKYLGCEVIGTEISETAEQFPHTIQWDFHETKPEWIDATDFIYSNSFDHSYDPQKCLDAWMSCIKKGGLCILEHSSEHSPWGASELDPFGADITLMPYLITTWGGGRYGVRELIQAPKKFDSVKYLYFIVIQKF